MHNSRQSKKRKYLKWFEEVFVRVSSGEDQPLQIEEFQQAIHTDRVSINQHPWTVYSLAVVKTYSYTVTYK